MKKPKILAAVLCAVLTTGCAKTPEEAIVNKKSGQKLESYREVTPKAEDDSQTVEPEQQEPERENALAKRLEVPERYQSSVQSEDGSFQLNADAKLLIPNVEQVGVYRVSQLPFDQALIDKVTKAFFGDSKIYRGDKYLQFTKEEIRKELEKLKKYQAEGNLDPHGYIARVQKSGEDIDPAQIYQIQEEIDSLERCYQTAPEKIEKIETAPIMETNPFPYFDGAVEMDGAVYSYRLQVGSGDHMSIEVERVESQPCTNFDWREMFYSKYYENGYNEEDVELLEMPTLEEAQKLAGITEKEAKEMADHYIQKLGLTEFEARAIQLALKNEEPLDAMSWRMVNATQFGTDAGYLVSYTRSVDGFPISYEQSYGGSLESMESTYKPWCYERVEILVNQKGLQRASIRNLYQIEEKKLENVELKTFPEIAKLFEQILQLKNTKVEGSSSFSIEDVTLGYMRVYDPGADSTSGLLVPVWDFFGSSKDCDVYEGEEYRGEHMEQYRSWLTVNAADGSIIDRSLGY